MATGDKFEFYFVFEKKVLSKIVDMKLSDWTEFLTPLLYCGIIFVITMSTGGCLHCASISRAGFLLSWVDRREWLDYGLCRGSSSRPRLGMYSPGCHQWRQSRDLLLAKPQSWTMVAARSLLGGENNGFVVTTEHIQIDTIPSPHHTRVQNGLVIVSSVCNSIIIHTTWHTQGSWLFECLLCILSLFPPESHLTRTLWRESRCSSVQLLCKYGINVQTLEHVTTK